jgi:transcriptional regulator with XRE-family HTH domain
LAFGRRVRERRVALGLSQEDLAERADLDRTYISGIERGLRNVSLLNITRLASALRVKVRDLF